VKRLVFTILVVAAICSIAQAKYSGGTGSPDDPYLISTAEDMNQIGRNYTDWDKCFKLTADINLSAYTGTQFSRIGPDDKHAFSGVFDGNGHAISGFTYTAESGEYIGVFGNISAAGRVENVSLVDVNVIGRNYVGGLVGNNSGTISNCSSTGAVSGSYELGGLVGYNGSGTLTGCYATGSVSGYSFVGGLVGYNTWGTVSYCYSTGIVSGGYNSDYVGGLVGENSDNSNVTNCYAAGEVAGDYDVGGLVGMNDHSTITRCYSSGSVSGYMYIGGLLGWNYSGTTADSFWDTDTSGQSWSAGGTGKTTAEMKTKSTFTDAEWNFFTIWDIVEGQTYPFFKSGGGTGTPDDPYQIATKADLLAMAADTSYYDKCFILTADIDMEGQVFTTAIIAAGGGTTFTGTFDGNDHKITNFTINGGDGLGLFGQISYGGSVKNLGLENFSVSGYQGVGGLVGWNYGNINNCHSTGSVSGYQCVGGLMGYNSGTISNCYSTGVVTGGDYSNYLGGLVGYSYGNISNCYSTGAVSGSSNSYYVGGLVGGNYGDVNNCYSTGTVSGNEKVGGLVGRNYGSISNISNCYSTGAVTGTSYLGGLTGYNDGGTISSCYFLNTSGPNDGNGTPLTDEQMKQQSSFVGWNFNDVWHICETTNYPKLIWQIPPADLVCPDGVNFLDYSFFAERWLDTNCATNNNCDGADFDFSGTVDIDDLAVMCKYWLQGL
jgi:hypothetical protein